MQPATVSVLLSTTGGTLLTLTTIHTEDLVKAVVLSVTGAITSFVTATLLGWLAKRFKRNR